MLVFQLKRFDYSQGQRGKLGKPVVFGTSLNVARFSSTPERDAIYKLYGVLVHAGQSAKSGHYYVFIKQAAGTWHCFDDEAVRAVPERTVLQQQAYLLFYEAAQPSKLLGVLGRSYLQRQTAHILIMFVGEVAHRQGW